jgi:hypothetical protein
MRDKTKSGIIAQVATETFGNHYTPLALHQLGSDYMEDTYMEILVDEILSSNTPQRQRTFALGRLLAAYGIGTIVTGRIG